MYRSIKSDFWTDPHIAPLAPLARMTFLYLVTNDAAHISGLYHLDDHVACGHLDCSRDALQNAKDALSRVGRVVFDGRLVWVVNMLSHQCRGDKIFRRVAKHLLALPPSPLLAQFCDRYPQVREHLPRHFCPARKNPPIGVDITGRPA